MLIRSQNKKTLVNFNQVWSLNAYEENGKARIVFIAPGQANYKHFLLGEYISIKRAFEILDEISANYMEYKVAMSSRDRHMYSLPRSETYIYQMPKH